MKRIATAVLAAATFAAPLAVSTPAAAQYRGDRDYDRDRDRDWDRDRDDDDRRDGRRYRRDRDRDWDRDDRRRYRRHWDRGRHNGYYYQQRWYYGPPPVAYYDDPYFNPGYRAWRRGERLPRYYRSQYDEVDWRYHRLRPPPRGYHYVEDDRGDYLLVGIATGVILGIILANN